VKGGSSLVEISGLPKEQVPVAKVVLNADNTDNAKSLDSIIGKIKKDL